MPTARKVYNVERTQKGSQLERWRHVPSVEGSLLTLGLGAGIDWIGRKDFRDQGREWNAPEEDLSGQGIDSTLAMEDHRAGRKGHKTFLVSIQFHSSWQRKRSREEGRYRDQKEVKYTGRGLCWYREILVLGFEAGKDRWEYREIQRKVLVKTESSPLLLGGILFLSKEGEGSSGQRTLCWTGWQSWNTRLDGQQGTSGSQRVQSLASRRPKDSEKLLMTESFNTRAWDQNWKKVTLAYGPNSYWPFELIKEILIWQKSHSPIEKLIQSHFHYINELWNPQKSFSYTFKVFKSHNLVDIEHLPNLRNCSFHYPLISGWLNLHHHFPQKGPIHLL